MRAMRTRLTDILEVEHPVEQVMKKRGNGLVDMRSLTAFVAMTADQHGAAVEAGPFVAVAVRCLAMRRFDRARSQGTRRDIADELSRFAHCPLTPPCRAIHGLASRQRSSQVPNKRGNTCPDAN